MSLWFYELPTTGAITFGDLLDDVTGLHTGHIGLATSSRAALRAVLKETKRMGAEKDYLRVIKIIDDYLPHLYGLMSCVEMKELVPRGELKFSWRSTLSSHTFKSSPRVDGTGLHYELCFTILTNSYALSNLAVATVLSLGLYEQERHLPESERKEKDEQLNFAAKLLCKAAGLSKYLSETVLPVWAKMPASGDSKRNLASERPPDVSPEVLTALPRIAMADAHRIAIRKLMSRTTAESATELTTHLPKSHPAPALLAKLWIHVHGEYSSSLSLVQNNSSKLFAHGPSSEIDGDLRKYLTKQASLALVQTYKWLGIDSGEHERVGEAIAFLSAAKMELANAKDLKDGGTIMEPKEKRKDAMADISSSVDTWLTKYKVANDSISFQAVPASTQIRSMVPNGRTVFDLTPFTPPRAAFSPALTESPVKGTEAENSGETGGQYAGSGQYF